MKLIDTHAHLYASVFKSDLDDVIQRAQKAGITKVLLPNVDSESSNDLHALCSAYPDYFLPMMGVHPCSITNEKYETELARAKKHLDNSNQYCAVGEIGIDLYWDKTTFEIQKKAFEIQIQWAIDKQLPICIHSRNATRECIDSIKPYISKGLKGVFHCFSGTVNEAKEIIDFGFYLGIGGVVTFKNGGLSPVIQACGLNRLVLETDAPYLAPVPYRGKRNESAYTSIVAHTIAEILNLPIEDVAKTTTFNAEKLFSINE